MSKRNICNKPKSQELNKWGVRESTGLSNVQGFKRMRERLKNQDVKQVSIIGHIEPLKQTKKKKDIIAFAKKFILIKTGLRLKDNCPKGKIVRLLKEIHCPDITISGDKFLLRFYDEYKGKIHNPKRKQNDKYRSYKSYLLSNTWQKKRIAVFARDKNKCQYCGNKARHIHHLTYINIYNELLKDLQAVCEECHNILHLK